jgi:hypothetical protein
MRHSFIQYDFKGKPTDSKYKPLQKKHIKIDFVVEEKSDV